MAKQPTIEAQIKDLAKKSKALSFGTFSTIRIDASKITWEGKSPYAVATYEMLEYFGFDLTQFKDELNIMIGPFTLEVIWRIPSNEIVILKRVDE